MGLLLVSSLADGALVPSLCSVSPDCSYPYTVSFTPVVPTTIVIIWRKAVAGPIDHTQTIQTSTGKASFQVPDGLWYVQLTITADDGSMAPTTAGYVIQYPSLLEPIGPVPPINFTVT